MDHLSISLPEPPYLSCTNIVPKARAIPAPRTPRCRPCGLSIWKKPLEGTGGCLSQVLLLLSPWCSRAPTCLRVKPQVLPVSHKALPNPHPKPTLTCFLLFTHSASVTSPPSCSFNTQHGAAPGHLHSHTWIAPPTDTHNCSLPDL